MNKLLLPMLFGLMLGGCHSRLLNGTPDQEIPLSEVTSSSPQTTEAPNFNIETPQGFTKTVHYGILKGTDIQIKNGSTIFVFLRDVGQWFKLGRNESGAFYYERINGYVRYHGPVLLGKEFCIYEFNPEP